MPRPLEILIVEDNPGDARLLRELLADSGVGEFTVHRAETMREAQARLAAQNFDVVLLDLSLPDAHGLSTVGEALSAAPSIPIIVLTGLDDQSLAVQAVQAGAQDYLVKGQVEPGLLGRSIRYAIERKHLALERERLLAGERDARRAAEAAVQARDQVLRVVSHDLGNHLAAIRINGTVLSRTIGDPAGVDANRQRAEAILQQVGVMDTLRQDLLDVASIEAGRLAMAPGRLDPCQIAIDATELALPVAESKQIDLRLSPRDDLPPIVGDADRLRQALGNLIGNAIKFTPPGGKIDLACEHLDGEVIFSVRDEGPGVQPEHVERIFDSFWKSREGNPGGAGLGLSIVRGIAEAHGGRVWFEAGEGGGSVFRLAIPVGG